MTLSDPEVWRRLIKWMVIGRRIYKRWKGRRMRKRQPLQIKPVRTEPRGEFPDHGDERPRPVLTAEQARALAYIRLRRWRDDHGFGD